MPRATNRSPSTIALYRRAVSFLDEGLAARDDEPPAVKDRS